MLNAWFKLMKEVVKFQVAVGKGVLDFYEDTAKASIKLIRGPNP